ncbi:FAD-dependent oxidoreductase [Pandoraea sputorum]|uniref:Trimethylamine dehydrogenase n=1 Tax=Pandoraea sputorum TaxID=93222 RepID=A0A239S9R9_9BURK|nr:FAD-dependent oxidoreductase [Pandoraea sputorum]AJC16091.1 trimethylamine dehydrogenase [Pandoraea sputorum]SNU82166.1 Trimethylamine dehydrogenase [Pandoraea sputorum]VVE44741.1 trimethylamine dehydrogenase [Pandoraea sputorum]
MRARDPRFDILFEPVQIGPVKTRNRFYQVPHCNGMGHVHPSAMAGMRAVKAEGGWGVVCTEECEISPLSEFSPYIEARLWDDRDIPALARMAQAVHAHGSLAGIELAFNGYSAPNRFSREIPWAPSDTPVRGYDPIQARAMTLADIRQLRQLHRAAALRARDAGFDIIYVYAGHDLGLPFHFLTPRNNRRQDEYGGAVENRLRLLRELIEDTKDAVGDRCAVAVRLAIDERMGREGLERQGDGGEIFATLAELPDLWDVNVADWSNDSMTSRFSEEGFQEQFLLGLKALTTKPVVGVGRFTSPDAMVSQVRRGVMDLIGAARPSIADPFLPEKIDSGRTDEIRECIGCNICVSSDHTMTPVRCTQNPTMGEEWRRGWHPERVPRISEPARTLVVGGGPAGLECARVLAERGYDVALVDAARDLGGRVTREARLPGLSAWIRVIDYRLEALRRLPNVEIYQESPVGADDVREFDADHVFVATGSHWRRDGLGRALRSPLAQTALPVITPDDVMAGGTIPSPVVLFDDDHYYMGSVMAELLRSRGVEVIFVTPAADVATWTHNTLEQSRIQRRLIELDVRIVASHSITGVGDDHVTLACEYTGRTHDVPAASLLLVTSRAPQRSLYDALEAQSQQTGDASGTSLHLIGDGLAPGTIAAAVYSGHRAARELGMAPQTLMFRREIPALGEFPFPVRPSTDRQ